MDMGDRPYAAIGARIRALREVHDLTQVVFAELCYVSQPSVSAWETGRSLPSKASQYRIADVLHASRSMLFREVVEREVAA